MEYLLKHGPVTLVAVFVSYIFNLTVVAPLYEEKFNNMMLQRSDIIARLDRIEERQQAFYQMLSIWSQRTYGEELRAPK